MKYIFLILFVFLRNSNAVFDYKLFHPTIRTDSFDLNKAGKPTDFAYHDLTNTLYFKTESEEFFVNDTFIVAGLRLKKIRQQSHAIFVTYGEPIGSDPQDFVGYGWLSDDEEFHTSIGGRPGDFMDVVYNKYAKYSMPVIEDATYRAILSPFLDGNFFLENNGFHKYDEVPHDHGFNYFDSVEDSVVNNHGLCARTTDGKYVCAGTQTIVDAWDTIHENYLTGNEDLKACATDDDIYILKGGNVAFVSTLISPTIFSLGNIDSISCTESHIVAHTTSNILYAYRHSDITLRTFGDVEAYQTNRKQLFIQFTTGEHKVVDFVNSDFNFNNVIPGANGIVMTDVSMYLTNGTALEAANPLATPKTLYVPNVLQVQSCADGMIMYVTEDNEWKIYSHEDVSDLQEILDTRYLLDIVTTEHYGCMIIKLTDASTGRDYIAPDYSRPDYGLIQENLGYEDYDNGYYEDSNGDVIFLATTTTVLVITLTGMIYYFVKIRV